jgi:adenosylhomocysteine nucleosidase
MPDPGSTADPADPANRVQLVVLAPMPSELRPVVRRLGLKRTGGPASEHRGTVGRTEVRAVHTGMGTAKAAAATEAALAGGAVDRVVVCGIAGAVDPALAIGDLLAPEVVLDHASGATFRPTPWEGSVSATQRPVLCTSDELIVQPDRVAELRARGIGALDMETSAVAAVCERHGVAWSVIRVVSDRADDGTVDPEIMTLTDADGRPNLGGLLRYLGPRPWRIAKLAKLAKGSKLATETAAAALAAGCAELGT